LYICRDYSASVTWFKWLSRAHNSSYESRVLAVRTIPIPSVEDSNRLFILGRKTTEKLDKPHLIVHLYHNQQLEAEPKAAQSPSSLDERPLSKI